MAGDFELKVPTWLRRGAHEDEQKWIESSHELLALVERSCGLSSLAGRSVLDMGCGTKMAKLLLEQDVPVARYAGMDVNRDVIEFLQTNVDDPRFTFHHLDVRNELYNPDGLPLQDRTELPVGTEQFDIIWLFSVFTHLEPADYRAMLKLLRRYIRDGGWLVFSLYINEVTASGFGPVDWWVRHERLTEDAHAEMARALDENIRERGQEWFERELHRHVEEKGVDWLAQQIDAAPESARGAMERELRAALDERGLTLEEVLGREAPTPNWFIDASRNLRSRGEPPDFVDLIPSKPLMEPLYSRRHAHELIEGTGWHVETLNPPEPEYIQHYFVCRPV